MNILQLIPLMKASDFNVELILIPIQIQANPGADCDYDANNGVRIVVNSGIICKN